MGLSYARYNKAGRAAEETPEKVEKQEITTEIVEENKKVVNLIKDEKFTITLKPGTRPYIAKERPVAFALREAVEAELHKLEKAGCIEACSQADYVSPIVAVRKPNGKVRVCGDFRKLNENIVDDKFPLPCIEDLFAKIGPGNTWFCKIDLEAAYHQIPVEKESQSLTTIITHIGTFKYKVMPFGVKTAPAAFQRIMEKI